MLEGIPWDLGIDYPDNVEIVAARVAHRAEHRAAGALGRPSAGASMPDPECDPVPAASALLSHALSLRCSRAINAPSTL